MACVIMKDVCYMKVVGEREEMFEINVDGIPQEPEDGTLDYVQQKSMIDLNSSLS